MKASIFFGAGWENDSVKVLWTPDAQSVRLEGAASFGEARHQRLQGSIEVEWRSSVLEIVTLANVTVPSPWRAPGKIAYMSLPPVKCRRHPIANECKFAVGCGRYRFTVEYD